MAAFFIIGEKKTRPGVYFRYENYGTPPIAGADDGTCAVTIRSDWGPIGKAVLLEGYNEIEKIFGTGGTTGVALEVFKGGARRAYVTRLGTGGTNASYSIMDTTVEGAQNVILLTMKYPGTRAFAVTIRPTLADETVTELILSSGTEQLERLTFPNTGNSVKALMDAYAEKGSDYFTLTKQTDSDQPLATVTQAEVSGGADPTVNNGAYGSAFEVLEAYRWNVLAIDTDEVQVHNAMQLFLNRIYDSGRFCMGVIGEPTTVSFEDRLSHASSFNDYQVVYVGNGFIDNVGAEYEGHMAAARIAGMIAGTPSNESITHTAVTGAVDLSETLTNAQYEQAIKAGMLTFSTSSAGTVWVEQGVNTLVLPGQTEDEGWKKIKRTKVRFELFQRLNDTIEGLVGNINNDPDGRMTVVQCCNGVCNAMVAEKKLLAGAYVEVDPNNAPAGDSAWFVVYADDIDSLEKLYFTFMFRFAPEVTE